MLVYKINQQINTEKLINSISKLIQKSSRLPDKEYLLVIKIQEIGVDDDSLIPKLEYKPEENS